MKRPACIVFLAVFCAALFAFPLRTLFGPHAGVSFYEQRSLAPLPSPTVEALWTGSFFSDAETALSDHAAWRDTLLGLDTRLNLALGRVKVNNLVVNADVLLDCYGFSRWDLGYLAGQAETAAGNYAQLQSAVQACGGYFCYLGLPQQSTYFADRYPSYMDSRLWHTTAIREAFGAAMDRAGVPFVSMYPLYQAQGMPEEDYFATDHHYTYAGAFAAAQALMERIDRDTGLAAAVPERADFTFTRLPNPFLGSANRKLYGLRKNADFLEIAVPKVPVPFTREDNGAAAAPAVFALPATDREDVTYSVYMGGDVGETVLKTHRPDLPSLLIYGDSFTNPLETLLYPSFNETRSLDFRYYTGMSLQEYIRAYRPDVVVCVRDESVYLSSDGNGTTG